MKRFILNLPVIGRILLIIFRFKFFFISFFNPIVSFFKWLFTSKETTNFTYDLTDDNILYMASFVSVVLNVEYPGVKAYIDEIQNNKSLKEHIQNISKKEKTRYKTDSIARFARRMAWYAIIRAKKPKIVIETGVDKGLGSCVIAAALTENEKEGYSGGIMEPILILKPVSSSKNHTQIMEKY